MKLFERITYKGKKYIFAGFGEISKKAYLIKKNKKGEYIVFNGKRTYINKK